MNTVRVTNSLNPRGAPVGSEFDTDTQTAARWVRRGWGHIAGSHEEATVTTADRSRGPLRRLPEADPPAVGSESDTDAPTARNRRKAAMEE